MPAFLDEPITADEPVALTEPDDSNIKAMAAKFRSLTTPEPPKAPTETPAEPPKDKPADKPAEKPAPTATDKPADPEIPDVKLDASSPVTRDHYKRLEQARDSYKERAEKYRKDHEAAMARAKQLEDDLNKTKAALPPNLEEVQKALADSKRIADEHKALTEQLETINLERSPRFQNWWKSETTKHIKVAQAHVPAEHREEFAKLMLAPPSPERDAALDAILEPLSNTAKRLAGGALEQLESLKIQRDEALTRGSERYRELQAFEKAEAEKVAKERQARVQSLSDEALRRAKAGFSAFQPTGDPAKDAELAGREAFVRAAVAGKLDEDILLNVPAAAVEYVHLRDTVIPALKAELEKQNALIKQLQGSGPRGSDGRSPTTKTEEPAKDGNSFAQKVLQATRR